MVIEQIEQLLRDYPWMKREVDRLQRALYGYASPMKSWGVAQYGIEAAMPKGSSGKSQMELRMMDLREERLYKRLDKFEDRVYALEWAGELLSDEKEKVVYDCILDGMSYRSIAHLLGMTRNQVKKTKDSILNQLSQNSQFVQLLNLEKSAC
ncbi:MAG: sigma-70 family RNA polymerase sigma factor [Bacillota bacterium]